MKKSYAGKRNRNADEKKKNNKSSIGYAAVTTISASIAEGLLKACLASIAPSAANQRIIKKETINNLPEPDNLIPHKGDVTYG